MAHPRLARMRASEQYLPAERLHELFDYDPSTGGFCWRFRADASRAWNTRWAGKAAGSVSLSGYLGISIANSGRHPAHTLAWVYYHGSWPDHYIYHVNGDKLDNRIGNLREMDGGQNALPLTAKRLREIVIYDSESGDFRWRNRIDIRQSINARQVGTIAGTLNRAVGYVYLTIDDRKYLAHRLAWFYSHAQWPTAEIDHINGNKTDNRLSNLREAGSSENKHNTPRRRCNTSGYKWVNYRSGGDNYPNPWLGRVRHKGKTVCVGYFEKAEEAHAACAEVAARLHGEFVRTD